MGLFELFTETIFLKTDSDLQKKIEKLSELQTKYPSNKKIELDLMLCKLGLAGENEIEYELKNANLGMYVLHDITIKYEDLTAQIDYIVVTTGKIYLIECKNMVGNITVNERGDFIREINHQKEGIYSPLRQAERHVEILKKIWLSRSGIFNKIFVEGRFDNWYVPLVVIANQKSILNTRYASKEIKQKIVKSDQLINYIKRDISTIDKNLLNSQKKTYEIANWLLSLDEPHEINIPKYELEEQENRPDNSNLKEEIRKRLIEFRTRKSKEKNIPAYYIFTNEELEKILEKLPQTIEELKSFSILSEIKIRLHGKEIVDIINCER